MDALILPCLLHILGGARTVLQILGARGLSEEAVIVENDLVLHEPDQCEATYCLVTVPSWEDESRSAVLGLLLVEFEHRDRRSYGCPAQCCGGVPGAIAVIGCCGACPVFVFLLAVGNIAQPGEDRLWTCSTDMAGKAVLTGVMRVVVSVTAERGHVMDMAAQLGSGKYWI